MMTDLERLRERLAALDQAIDITKKAATVDRKMSHDKHTNGHYTKALSELDILRTGIQALIKRHEIVGR